MSKQLRTFVLLLIILMPVIVVEASKAQQPIAQRVPQAEEANKDTLILPKAKLSPLACPALAGYDNSLEQPNYCVYYTDSTTDANAALVEGYVDDYWDRYSVDLGFNAPLFTAPKLEARIDGDAGCNGSAWDNRITVFDGCFDAANPEFMQYVTGHEVFHRVQFASDPDWDSTWSNSAWIYEGTARNMEDASFANVDNWDNCLGVVFSYCDEVNDYLAFTNADITSWNMRYEANLFWTFFREQYGSTTTEPQRGVDALVELWNQMCCAESVSAVNNTLAVLEPGTIFDEAFRQFAVANYTKDLTNLPDDSYNYVDEDEVNNPAPYGPLTPSNGGTINSGTSATWTGEFINKYGAAYYMATPSATDCPVITANFERTAGSPGFYHVVTQSGNVFNTHVTGSSASWTQSFINDGITKVVAIAGGLSNSQTVDLELSCATPVINIELPNQNAPAYVGAFASPDDMVVQVSVTNGSPTGPVVAGLSNADFRVEVGGTLALVLSGGFVQEEYFLLVDTPAQGANGPYDLTVSLEEPGTTNVVATDTETEAVVYDNTNSDHVIVTDVSGSMSTDNKITAAENAAHLFIDAANSSEGLGLASYHHDVDDTLGIQFATLPHRTDAHNQVDSYIPGGATSIGDGLNAAVGLRAASATGNTRCQFTLLSDGMENSSLFWSDVKSDVIDTGCPVMTIAFGQSSNELLMQEIATETGGSSYYNDVFVSAINGPENAPAATEDVETTELGLGDTYVHTICQAQGCERLLSAPGQLNKGQAISIPFSVDSSLTELRTALDWRPIYFGPSGPEQESSEMGALTFNMKLVSPTGVEYMPGDYAYGNGQYGHAGYNIKNPEAGQWQAVVIYNDSFDNRNFNLMVYGQTDIGVKLATPKLYQLVATGQTLPLYALWLPGGNVDAMVTSPDGTETLVPLFDDGQHDDGRAGDGLFGGKYTLVNQAVEVSPLPEQGGEDPPPDDEGGYQIHLIASLDDIKREMKTSVAVTEGDDSNNDGIPDDFVAENCPEGATSDADLDKLDCSDEYFAGTDPNDSDTDGDGESDKSEVDAGLDPLSPGDDEIEAPEYVDATAQNGSVLLTYDVKDEYQSMLAYRASSPDGPWTLITTELSLTGVYSDMTVVNGNTYYYCIQARDAGNHWSAVVCSEEVRPREDPIPPEAAVLINDGAASTMDPEVVLSFIPMDEEHEAALGAATDSFDDIAEVMISNDPSFNGATWQPFAQEINWQLEPGSGLRTVYVRFMDENGNESVGTETATILLGGKVYLPLITKH